MLALRFFFLSLSLLAATQLQAQTTYRWIDKGTGLTVYSDQPPPPGIQSTTIQSGGNSNEQPQSYAARQAAEKYPVTLYTTADCTDTCAQARTLLNGRGVPFTEKMLSTQEEVAELSKRLGSEASVPSLSVGAQNFRGFESGAWNNLLDLAGYPTRAPYGAKPSGVFAR